MNKNKWITAIVVIVAVTAAAAGITYGVNHSRLQSKMDVVIASDTRNKGISVNVHYGSYINGNELVYNLKSYSPSSTPADIFRVFLQFSSAIKDQVVKQVTLAYRGKPKYLLDGVYFNSVGKEYEVQNPIYTMRTFPENLKNMDGSDAYSKWTGGLLGVLAKQMDDFNDFISNWCDVTAK